MPKLPIVNARQLIKALEKLGFYKHRQRGTSHLILAHSDGRRTTVPMHSGKDLPKGTLKGILRDLEISTEEFTSLLKK